MAPKRQYSFVPPRRRGRLTRSQLIARIRNSGYGTTPAQRRNRALIRFLTSQLYDIELSRVINEMIGPRPRY